jgi:hypothetical protein
MATTVERRRSGLSNKPALGGRSGYEAGDARIPITARGHPRLTTPGRIHSRRRRKGQPTSSLQNGGGFFAQLARRARARRLNCPSPQSRAAAGCAPPAPAATSRDGRTRLMARPPSRTDLDRPDVRWNPMPHAAASLRHADAFLRHHAGLGVRGTSRFPSLGSRIIILSQWRADGHRSLRPDSPVFLFDGRRPETRWMAGQRHSGGQQWPTCRLINMA